MLEGYQGGWFGVDKVGRPILYDKTGYVLIDKLFSSITLQELKSIFVHYIEGCLKHKFLACSHLYDKQIMQYN